MVLYPYKGVFMKKKYAQNLLEVLLMAAVVALISIGAYNIFNSQKTKLADMSKVKITGNNVQTQNGAGAANTTANGGTSTGSTGTASTSTSSTSTGSTTTGSTSGSTGGVFSGLTAETTGSSATSKGP
jgi:hypothetical protein